MKIGARIIKTAIAVSLCILFSTLFDNNSGFFMAIAAVITMQSSVSSSFIKGKERVFGTLTGAILGFVFALIDPGNLLLIGLGIILTIHISNLLNLQGSVVIACVVFLAIMTNNTLDPFHYSFNRIVDTSAGIAIALLVNYLILPLKPVSSVYEECGILFNELSQSIDEILYENKNGDLEILHEKIMDLKKSANINELDALIHQENEEEIKRLDEIIEGLISIYEHLKFVEELKQTDSTNIFSAITTNTIEQQKIPHMILEFHTQKVLKEWTKVKSLWKKTGTR